MKFSNDVENYEIEVTKWAKVTQLFLECCCSCTHGITSNYSALWSRPEQLHMQNMHVLHLHVYDVHAVCHQNVNELSAFMTCFITIF